ncbi:hypothetical protein PHET_08927 [Paragonimus heterotremus]|uniref:Uncharacterized protein n=1 Tax=Paragonimus heterotremus TaxID=100268 RepID=A0A8J4T3R5_9TREM|nr:hypothetical protein PHET_08927 [Paragonimus heterotremus]
MGDKQNQCRSVGTPASEERCPLVSPRCPTLVRRCAGQCTCEQPARMLQYYYLPNRHPSFLVRTIRPLASRKELTARLGIQLVTSIASTP